VAPAPAHHLFRRWNNLLDDFPSPCPLPEERVSLVPAIYFNPAALSLRPQPPKPPSNTEAGKRTSLMTPFSVPTRLLGLYCLIMHGYKKFTVNGWKKMYDALAKAFDPAKETRPAKKR
jgi:hypothetical protein